MLNPVSESGRDLSGYKRLLLLPLPYNRRSEGGKVFCSLSFILSSLGTLSAPISVQRNFADFCSCPTKGVQSKIERNTPQAPAGRHHTTSIRMCKGKLSKGSAGPSSRWGEICSLLRCRLALEVPLCPVATEKPRCPLGRYS